jgi:large subunit ribosomal protein L24
MFNKIKKGDKVQIMAGKDRLKRTGQGQKTDKSNQGKVLQVLKSEGKIVVEGLNLHVKHVRPKRSGEKGQKISYPAPMDISNVMVVCPKCGNPTRLGFRLLDTDKKSEKKARLCRKCKEVID